MTDYTQQILDNPSGGTVSLDGQPLPAYGYFVGGRITSLIIDLGDPAQPGADIDNFVKEVESLPDTSYLGWWTDEESGALYVDATTWVPDVDKALRLGEERGEIAIFDISVRSSLYLED